MQNKRGSQVRSFSLLARKRGLSPVIATVLLVGLVVVSGLIIFTWFRGLTQEAVTKFDQNIQLVCKDVKFEAKTSNGKLDISNIGNIPIFGFKLKITSSSGYETRDIKELGGNWPSDGLNQGGTASVNLAGLSGQITMTPILVGTSQKGAQASFACDEGLYGYQISL